MPGKSRQPIEVRFAAYLVKAGDDDCWGWCGPVTNAGHPTLGRGGKGAGQVSARIVAYRIATGNEPDREVMTTCNSRCCLNPRHLVLAGGEKSRATMRERFEARVEKSGPDDCWLWKLKPGAAGYGCLSMGKGNNPLLAHRVAWELTHGPIPEGLFVKQRCQNRLCCNPAHLYLSLNPIDGPEEAARAVEAWLRTRA
ncbi:MAG: HNH endonuclease signature motif containing protein [Gemmataceae bacterium]